MNRTAINPNTSLPPVGAGAEIFISAGIQGGKFYLVRRREDGKYQIDLDAGSFASLTGADQKIAIDPSVTGHVVSKGSAILHRPHCYSLPEKSNG